MRAQVKIQVWKMAQQKAYHGGEFEVVGEPNEDVGAMVNGKEAVVVAYLVAQAKGEFAAGVLGGVVDVAAGAYVEDFVDMVAADWKQ